MLNDELMRKLKTFNRRIGRAEAKPPGSGSISAVTAYTPTYLGGTTPGVTTYTVQVGRYIQIGNLIVAMATVGWSAATGTGTARFSLPLAASSTANLNSAVAIEISNVTFAAGTPVAFVAPGNNYMTLISPATNAAGTAVAIEAAGSIVYTVCYFID